jgi:hypothetical protein
MAGHGWAWRGLAWFGRARYGMARQGFLCTASFVGRGHDAGVTGQGLARPDLVGRSEAGPGWAGFGEAWQGD